MKKIVNICIVLSLFFGVAIATSYVSEAGPMTNAQIGLTINQIVGTSGIDTDKFDYEAKNMQPIEPAVIFLFGIGIIGMITLHRLKFR